MEQRHSVASNRNPIRQYRFAASSPGSRQQHGDDLFGNVSYPFCNGNPSEIRKRPLKTSRLSRASVAHGLRVLLNLGRAAPRFKRGDASIGHFPGMHERCARQPRADDAADGGKVRMRRKVRKTKGLKQGARVIKLSSADFEEDAPIACQ